MCWDDCGRTSKGDLEDPNARLGGRPSASRILAFQHLSDPIVCLNHLERNFGGVGMFAECSSLGFVLLAIFNVWNILASMFYICLATNIRSIQGKTCSNSSPISYFINMALFLVWTTGTSCNSSGSYKQSNRMLSGPNT